MRFKAVLFFLAFMTVSFASALAEVERKDFFVQSEPNVQVFVREVLVPDIARREEPVVLIHGARVPGVASFDLEVPGGSLAIELAKAGSAVYIVDIRGYGYSTRPAAMGAPREASMPMVRTGSAVRDLAAAIEAVMERTGAKSVALLGWATGGHWGGAYASLYPDNVSKVIFYNTLYGYTAEHSAIGIGSRLSNPDAPRKFNIDFFKNYRLNTEDSLSGGWDRSIPMDDKSVWRDPVVLQAYKKAALASDKTSQDRQPASFRSPSGAMADSFLLATGAALWDARLIQADALIIRSSLDFWSREQDQELLAYHLSMREVGKVRSVVIDNATHYVHLDRDDYGRRDFLNSVIDFLIGKNDHDR